MYIAQAVPWHKVSGESEDDLEFVEGQDQHETRREATGSDGSTVGDNSSNEPVNDDNTEADGGDLANAPLAYLQNLNSGNLMQFSQQSVLQEMMLQEMKPNLNTLPTLENHNLGGYEFGMVLKEPPRSHWMFSVPLNKLYIRMNKTFNIDVEFKAKMPIQPLNLRAFLCFVKEVSGPVLRCQNHLSTDPVKGTPQMRECLLRCENPATKYCGTSKGKSIQDRYSVLVPLNQRPNHSGYVRQTLALEFACQNSCFGRKETCLVFCLENASGEILGQQVLCVKICTCPKRDRNIDERHINSQKRKLLPATAPASEDENADVSVAKARRLSASSYQLKDENESNDSSEVEITVPENWDLTYTGESGYRLTLECPTKDLLLHSIEGMIEKTATTLLLSTRKSDRVRGHVNNLLDLKKYALKLP